MSKLTFLLGMFLFWGCDQNNPASTTVEDLGRIQGKVVNQNGIGVGEVYLKLEGTSFHVFTGPQGDYCFYNVPSGTYKLILNNYTPGNTLVEEIRLSTNMIYSVHEIRIETTNNLPGNYYYQRLLIFNTAESLIYNGGSINQYYSSRNQDIINIYDDTLKLQLNLIKSGVNLPVSNTDTVVLFVNHIPVDTIIPVKGRVITNNIYRSGMDTLQFRIHGLTEIEIVLYKTMPRVGNYISITTGKAGLSRFDYYSSPSQAPYIIIDSEKYYVSSALTDSVDWDVMFVNDSSQDTCYWKNQNPDWGVMDYNEDDPQFNGDIIQDGYFGNSSYASDHIYCQKLKNGTYSIYIQMFDALPGIKTAIPTLSIQLGFNDKLPELSRLIELSPVRSMLKGEIWFAGKLNLPEQTFNTSGQHISAKQSILASKYSL